MSSAMIGSPPTLEWVDVGRLQVDEAYQRSIEGKTSQRLIASMCQQWDWRLCQPLAVSRRTDTGLWVIDGQHRLAGARARGDIPHLPCVISSFDTVEAEANSFVALNTKRQKLSQRDLFAASLASGDPHAHKALSLIEAAGLQLARHSNYASWKPGWIICATAVQKAVRQFGPTVVSNALVALSEAYKDKVLHLAGTLLPALYAIYSKDAKRPEFDPDRFIAALSAVDQDDWLAEAAQLRAGDRSLSRVDSIALAMIEQYDALAETMPVRQADTNRLGMAS